MPVLRHRSSQKYLCHHKLVISRRGIPKIKLTEISCQLQHIGNVNS